MVGLGDSLAIFLLIAGLVGTAWGCLMACLLLFPARVEASKAALLQSSWRSLGMGLASLLVLILGFTILTVGPGIFKLLGWMIVAGHLAIAFVGIGGISRLAADRFLGLSAADQAPVVAYSKSAGIVVVAGLLPVLGWLFFAPLAYILGAGSAIRSVTGRRMLAEVR